MNNAWTSIATFVLVSTVFAGCMGGNGDDGGDHVDGGLDENAVYDDVLADTGFQVAGGLTSTSSALASGANGSAASAKVVSTAMDDSSGPQDKADFLIDVRTADGSRVQAVLRSMVTGDDVNLDTDLLGGVGNNVQVFGTTGVGPSEFPETKAYIALFGLSRLKIGDSTVERPQFTQVFVTQGIRDASGALGTAVDSKDLEMHVILGSTAASGENASGPSPIPDVADGYLYYYFENVRVKQMDPEDKAEVGSKLTPPEKPNVPPIVVARVILPNGTAATTGQVVSTSAQPGNLTVFLDASISQDQDGTIEAYSWDIKETNATGALVPAGNQSKPSGANVSFTFNSAGLKAIGLRIIDNDGGIANTTVFFFVDYLLKASYTFAGAGSVGAGSGSAEQARCTVPNNCNEHSFQVGYNAQKLITSAVKQDGGNCMNPHVDIFDPAGTKVAGTNTGKREIAAEALTGKVGKWKIQVWFEAQATCKYSFDINVLYAPIAAPETA